MKKFLTALLSFLFIVPLQVNAMRIAQEYYQMFVDDCNTGNGERCAGLALDAEDRDNQKLANEYYLKACNDAKHGPSCLILGEKFYSGNGVEQSVVISFKLAYLGCSLKHRASCEIMQDLIKVHKEELKRNIKPEELDYIKYNHRLF